MKHILYTVHDTRQMDDRMKTSLLRSKVAKHATMHITNGSYTSCGKADAQEEGQWGWGGGGCGQAAQGVCQLRINCLRAKDRLPEGHGQEADRLESFRICQEHCGVTLNA